MKKIITLLLILNVLSYAELFPYNGIVVDSAGNPLSGVRVLSINQKQETFTDSNGHFGDYNISIETVSYSPVLKPWLDKNQLFYYSGFSGEKVIISIFDLRGRKISFKKEMSNKKGINSINLEPLNLLAAGFYTIKVRIGHCTFALKTLKTGFSSKIYNKINDKVKKNKRLNFDDTLFINANGFNDTLLPISNTDIGEVVLRNEKDTSDFDFSDIEIGYDSTNFPILRKDTLILSVEVNNTGSNYRGELQCELSTNDTNISVIDNMVLYHDSHVTEFEAGTFKKGEGFYKVLVPRTLPAGYKILFNLKIKKNFPKIHSVEKLLFMPHPLSVTSLIIDDDSIGNSNGNDDGYPGLGETVEFDVHLKNDLGFKINNLSGLLISDTNNNVWNSNHVQSFGNLDVDEEGYNSTHFIFDRVLNLHVQDIMNMDILAYCNVEGKERRYVIPVAIPAFKCGTMTDPEGNVYRTVVIGDQEWMMDNLRSEKYIDGTPIPGPPSEDLWYEARITEIPYYCWFNDKKELAKSRNYGALYNWFVINPANPYKITPPGGWRIPTDKDWSALENYLISNGHNWDGSTEENKLAKSVSKSEGEWLTSTNDGAPGNNQGKNNSSGFCAELAGYRDELAVFTSSEYEASWWSQTEDSNLRGRTWSINLHGKSFTMLGFPFSSTLKECGNSIRLVRDLK